MTTKKVKKMRLKVFSADTYRNCKIEEFEHRKKFICTFPKGDSFEFRLSLDRSQLKVEFDCIYRDKDGKGVVMYRGPIRDNEALVNFWHELSDMAWKRSHDYQDTLRNKVLDEFDFNWKGE